MRESRTYGSVRGQCREALVYSTTGLLCSEINVYIPFTHPKSAPWQAPFYAGLRVVDLRSSPATRKFANFIY